MGKAWTARYLALAALGAVLLYCALNLLERESVAMPLFCALMAGGTLLARMPVAPKLALAAGVVATLDACLTLFVSKAGGVVGLKAAYLASGLLLCAAAYALVKDARRKPTAP